MEINLCLKGIILGFSIAAPVGPIGVLCIRRTLMQGIAFGLISGLGAATADAIYGCIAGFGLTFISTILIGGQIWLRSIGGIFLVYLGIKTILSKPSEQTTLVKGNNLISAYISTFFLTITNPMTIISFTAIFSGLGLLGTSVKYMSAIILVFGVFTGSALWWIILSTVTGFFRAKFNSFGLQWINKISGLIIIGFGLFSFLDLRE
jgi:threonine/homoserine/homoserine lactone efflux protein